MSEETVYAKGIYIKKGKFGLKVSIKVDEFVSQLQSVRNEKGYANFDLNERKSEGKHGDSHYLKLDTWKPAPKDQPQGDGTVDDLPY